MPKLTNKQYRLNELITYYDTCNRAEGKSPRTISWYTSNLNYFQTYIKNRHIPDSLNSIDTKLLREYIIYLFKRVRFQDHPYTHAKSEPLSMATIHGHVRTLRAFFNWLLKDGITDLNIAKDIKPPKLPRKVISTLSDEEIRAILGLFDIKYYSGARNQAIFMLLLDTGLRIGEVVNLNLDDTHIDEGFLKVVGKGNKERLVPVGNNARKHYSVTCSASDQIHLILR